MQDKENPSFSKPAAIFFYHFSLSEEEIFNQHITNVSLFTDLLSNRHLLKKNFPIARMCLFKLLLS